MMVFSRSSLFYCIQNFTVCLPDKAEIMDDINKAISEPGEANDEQLKPAPTRKRSLGLSMLLIFSLVYNGLILLFVILGLFFPGILQEIFQSYYKQFYLSKFLSFLFVFIATIILGVSFYGLVLLWKSKKKGYYYFVIAQAIILNVLVLVLHSYDWINIGIVLTIIIILGFSIRKMR